jgi:Putative zinc-finger
MVCGAERQFEHESEGVQMVQSGKGSQQHINEFHLYILEKGEFTCEDVGVLLCDYADAELPAALRERFESHLEQCPHCEQATLEYMQVIALAAELREPDPLPADVQERLYAGLNAKLGLNLKS